MSNESARSLVGQSLEKFKVVEMTEVYRINEDGRKTESLGFFKDPKVAKAFVGVQADASWYKTTDGVLVLTDGEVGYVLNHQVRVKLFNDEEQVIELKRKIMAKLSPEERALIGLQE